jgi:hypothetical protein
MSDVQHNLILQDAVARRFRDKSARRNPAAALHSALIESGISPHDVTLESAKSLLQEALRSPCPASAGRELCAVA